MKAVILLVVILLNCNLLHAQLPDSVNYTAELRWAFSNQDYLPQWSIANRFGTLEDQSLDGFLLGGIHAPYNDDSSKFKLAFGFDYLLKPEITTSRVQQAYAKAKYYFIELSIGRVARTVGTHNTNLSTGSLAVSQNARPMPIVSIEVPCYTPVPFTQKLVHFKGNLLHGWFEGERYIEKPLLHEKSFYLKLGKPQWPVSLYGGLVHFAQWGGVGPSGSKVAEGFSDYLRVFTGRQAATSSGGGEFVNALGNHLGILNLGITVQTQDVEIEIYHQDPFEDELSLTRNLVLYDQLLGINIKPKKLRFVRDFLYEYINTTYQGGPGIPDPRPGDDPSDLSDNYGYEYGGRDDYYNNYLYQSGWTYQQRLLGNPLLLSRNRTVQFLNDIPDFRFSEASANNRIIAHHIGITSALDDRISLRILATYSRNFGTYAGLNDGRFNWASQEPGYEDYPYPFKNALNQYYTFIESTYRFNTSFPLELVSAIAYDFGEMYQAFGLTFGVKSTGLLYK